MQHTKKLYLTLALLVLLFAPVLWGQTPETVSAATPATNANEFATIMSYVLTSLAITTFIVSLWLMVRTNSFLTKRVLQLEAEKRGVTLAVEPSLELAPQDDFFTRLRKKYWENPVPIAREGEITLNHNYDGIRELDNHLPPWWVNMFAITCVWALGYMWFYHWGGEGPDQLKEYEMAVKEGRIKSAKYLANKANAVDETSVIAMTEPQQITEGANIFKASCVACHGVNGEGTVGPNLTDEYWLHGGGVKEIFKTIKYGVPEKGMIAWSAQLKPIDMQKVTSYILTLKGTNPPNPKAPQGEIWKEVESDEPAVLETPKSK
jgi:cytochrome c oxidase cbb3-type subunit III